MDDSLKVACPQCHALNRVPLLRLDEAPTCGRCRKPLFAGHPVVLGVDSFAAHQSRSDLPLLVDFWAPWCQPCLMMAPNFEAAAGELEPNVRLAKVDTQSEPTLAQQFGIRSIPTLVLFARGQEVARKAGAMGALDIIRWTQANLPRR
ncbi:thioredoxin TrxC [Thermomonas sp.]